ncbi:MAG: response regulator transcription factor [Desulfuromonadales bacterium]|nr:response regulator transcription factor [Desulfuromonadales bacterium]
MSGTSSRKTARIFLIDDHPAVRQGLKLLLSQESHIVCGEAGNGTETFARIGSSGADVALLDLSLGEENGLDLIEAIGRLGASVLVYSMHEDAETIEKAFAHGAKGYVTKREMADVLLAAIADLHAGQRHISPRAAQSLANRALSLPEPKRESLLSDRERQILTLLGQGESNADIAATFSISVRTVETYYSRIIDKLSLDGMKELRRYAIKNRQY